MRSKKWVQHSKPKIASKAKTKLNLKKKDQHHKARIKIEKNGERRLRSEAKMCGERDLQYFRQLLRQALPQEKLEIHSQIQAILVEKNNLIWRQTEQKQLKNERMARALKILARMRNNEN
jgi:hypothetical protein